MTRLTALVIQSSDDLTVSSYGPVDGKFGVYIGTVSYSPSGCERPLPLLTSEPIYLTAESAQVAADGIVSEAKALNMEATNA